MKPARRPKTRTEKNSPEKSPQKNLRRKNPSGEEAGAIIEVTPRLLRGWPLPQPDADADKTGRGRVLAVGGASEMPGVMILAATAALRSGAGTVQMAVGRSIAVALGIAVPEARVFALPETSSGAIAVSGAESIAGHANRVDAFLLGPGMIDTKGVIRLAEDLLPRINGPVVLLDAAALDALSERRDLLHRFDARAIVTPHEGEVKRILGIGGEAPLSDRPGTARQLCQELGAVVVLKGSETFIAAPGGELYRNRAGNSGLAISGSGDTLSGIIAGLAARGAEPVQAAVWGVYLHARAGERLAKRMGPLGYLPRELLAEIPALMAGLK